MLQKTVAYEQETEVGVQYEVASMKPLVLVSKTLTAEITESDKSL